MTPAAGDQLAARALRVREHIIRMASGGGCFLGASLSCADLLVYLYSAVLNVSPATTSDPNRDYLFLSKGHDVPALYGTLADLGFIDVSRLEHHLSPRDAIYWHPNRAVRGVEFHSGSLGHLLAVGIGVALGIRLSGGQNRVFVVVGDGELNEGSVWEAALVAAAKGLDNLTVVVDRNGFQANVATEALVPLEPLAAKFEAFGWCATTVDGHAFEDLERGFAVLPLKRGRPSVVIARTIRGKGLARMEGRADRWFVALTDDEVRASLSELRGGALADVTSDTLMVR